MGVFIKCLTITYLFYKHEYSLDRPDLHQSMGQHMLPAPATNIQFRIVQEFNLKNKKNFALRKLLGPLMNKLIFRASK